MPDLTNSALLTDLYQLTMLQAYHREQMNGTAVFELAVRRLPTPRNFLMAAGLAQALDYVEQLRFRSNELDWLAGCGLFSREFVDHLASWRFTGDIHALPEGTIFFANEPVLRVTAPLAEAQLVESRLINLLQFQTLIASKAARSVLVAGNRTLVDFGFRRAHGAEAGLLAARAAYIAGFAGTATVLAGSEFAIPVFGTMAHSFIQSHASEEAAFEEFALANPNNVVLLLDTYDTERGAERAVAVAQRLRARGISVRGVRLDSGDLAEHARQVRRILDSGGLSDTTIFVSGGLDETDVRDLLASGAPIDGFGIGTQLDASADAPTLDCAYKLVEYDGRPCRKRSEGKVTWPGRKQVFRTYDAQGVLQRDVVVLQDDAEEGAPLLECVMRAGKRTKPSPTLAEIRATAKACLDRLPPALRKLEPALPYPVAISDSLESLARQADKLSDR